MVRTRWFTLYRKKSSADTTIHDASCQATAHAGLQVKDSRDARKLETVLSLHIPKIPEQPYAILYKYNSVRHKLQTRTLVPWKIRLLEIENQTRLCFFFLAPRHRPSYNGVKQLENSNQARLCFSLSLSLPALGRPQAFLGALLRAPFGVMGRVPQSTETRRIPSQHPVPRQVS